MAERKVEFTIAVTISNDEVDRITDTMVEELDLFQYDDYNVGDFHIEMNYSTFKYEDEE